MRNNLVALFGWDQIVSYSASDFEGLNIPTWVQRCFLDTRMPANVSLHFTATSLRNIELPDTGPAVVFGKAWYDDQFIVALDLAGGTIYIQDVTNGDLLYVNNCLTNYVEFLATAKHKRAVGSG